MSAADDWLGALPGLAALALAGRAALAWLPPGRLGSHDLRAWPATWAAAHVLGAIVVCAAGRAAELAGFAAWPAALAAVLGGLALARFATRPAAMVPRHEVRAERPSAFAKLAGLALAAALVRLLFATTGESGTGLARAGEAAAGFARGPCAGADPLARWFELAGAPNEAAGRVFAWTSAVALFALLAHGLERARRAPAERRLWLFLFALTPGAAALAGGAEGALAALGPGAGAALSVAWFRRADRRALGLAALAHASGAGWNPGAAGLALALAGLALLVICTPRPSRARAAAWAGAALALQLPLAALCEPAWAGAAFDPSLLGAAARQSLARLGPLAPLAALALLGGALGLRGRRWRPRFDPSRPSAVGEPGRELAASALIVAAAPLALAGLDGASSASWLALGRALEPVLALAAGLVLARAERPRGWAATSARGAP